MAVLDTDLLQNRFLTRRVLFATWLEKETVS